MKKSHLPEIDVDASLLSLVDSFEDVVDAAVGVVAVGTCGLF